MTDAELAEAIEHCREALIERCGGFDEALAALYEAMPGSVDAFRAWHESKVSA
jgi:hypothetical protein